MKKIILIAATSFIILGVNAQSKGKSEAKKELKQIENRGKDKARAVQSISASDAKRSKQEVKAIVKDKQEKQKEFVQDKKDLNQEIKANKGALKEKVKAEKDNAKEVKDKVVNSFDVSDAKEKRPELEKEKKEKPHTNNGNAHGKDKGELSGKDFGQERAKQARLNTEVKKKELVNTLSEAETKYNSGKDKVKAAKEKLEADKTAGKISEEEYLEKASKIKKAEVALDQLKNNISKSKSIQ